MSERVTIENFDRAESDRYFESVVLHGGFGRLEHERGVMPIDRQTVRHGNRDTLYSSGVFDLEAATVTVTLPDPRGRYVSLVVVDEHLYTHADIHEPGTYVFSRAAVGTRYMLLEVRWFVDTRDAADLEVVHELQDAVVVTQQRVGLFEVPLWDDVSEAFVRDALLALRSAGHDPARLVGSRDTSDPITHLVELADTGGTSDRGVLSIEVTPEHDDGVAVHRLTVHDAPVDGFWSISVYNRAGYFERNEREAYTVNSITAEHNVDGTITVQFGGCDRDTPNCLPITPGWRYIVRLYAPRAEILDGDWQFPRATLDTRAFQDAFDLVLWGLPIAGTAALRHAYLHDAGARDLDIVYWPAPPTQSTQLPTIYGASCYVLAMFETFHSPVILEVPPGGALVGSILDAWQQPVADIGPDGADRGRGARFLLRAPGDTVTEIEGTIPVTLGTFTGYALLRASGGAVPELAAGVRVAPLEHDHRRVPEEPRYIDMTNKPFDGVMKLDEWFFADLARIIAVEPIPDRDHARLDTLRGLARASQDVLASAAVAAHELLVRRIGEQGLRVWPARNWRRLPEVEAHQGGEGVSRALVAFRHYAPATRQSGAALWLHAFVDVYGDALVADRGYRLRVPAGTPRWTATAYARATCAFIRGASAIEIASNAPGLVVDPDGSVELDFGARPRAGREANFIHTVAPWFVTVQVTGARSDDWELPDLVPDAASER